MPNDNHYLMCMNQCIGRIMKYSHEGRSAFMASLETQDAVVWNLALIGAAVKRLSKDARKTHPEVDWGHIIGMFADLMENPWDYDREKVWECCEHELPELRHELRGILVSRHVK